jgi:hypothetical protein
MRHEDFSPIMPMASAITAYMDDHPRQTTVSLGRPTVAATIENVPTGWSSLHVRRHVFYAYVTITVGRPEENC